MTIDKESKSAWKAFVVAMILATGIVVTILYCSGCAAMYENTGSRTRVGTVTAPIDVSDGTDSFTLKLLYGMDGADVYTKKDSKVSVTYDNCWTNNYIGMVETKGIQHLKVDVEPLYVGDDADTNTVDSVKE